MKYVLSNILKRNFFLLWQCDFPAKLRVVISNRANTVLVRHYEIKQECHMVEIKANGDIWCDEQPRLAANEGTVMQFNCKTYNQKYWKKAKNSHFLPETVHISPTTATKFWAKEKSVVQNALLCCQVIANFLNFPCVFFTVVTFVSISFYK